MTLRCQAKAVSSSLQLVGTRPSWGPHSYECRFICPCGGPPPADSACISVYDTDAQTTHAFMIHASICNSTCREQPRERERTILHHVPSPTGLTRWNIQPCKSSFELMEVLASKTGLLKILLTCMNVCIPKKLAVTDTQNTSAMSSHQHYYP